MQASRTDAGTRVEVVDADDFELVAVVLDAYRRTGDRRLRRRIRTFGKVAVDMYGDRIVHGDPGNPEPWVIEGDDAELVLAALRSYSETRLTVETLTPLDCKYLARTLDLLDQVQVSV